MLPLLAILVSLSASAQTDPCAADRARLCAQKSRPSDIQECLIAAEKGLSQGCREETLRWLQIRKEAAARGGGSLSAFGGPGAMGPPMRILSLDGRYSPGNRAPEFSENKVGITTPVFKGEKDTFAISLNVGSFHFGETVTLDNGRKLPRDLYRLEAGAQNHRQLADKKNWSLRVSAGHNGDEPFKEAADASYSLIGTYGFPGSGSSYWIALVYFSNNGPLGNFIPIPGLSYMVRREGFTGIFGFPFTTLQWSFPRNRSYSFSIFGPSVQTEFAQGDPDRAQFFGGYAWQRQNFILREREDSKHRLTITEQKFYLGARKVFAAKVLGEFQAGHAFERQAYVGDGLFDHEGGRTYIPAEWFGLLSFKLKY